MKTLVSCLCLPLLALGLQAEEARPAAAEVPVGAATNAALPWLGLDVGPLDAATRAQAPRVPTGVGFLVTGVTDSGPAAQAGIRRFDILWRVDGQLLVNEAQFAVLLSLHRPGDEVKLSVLRSGDGLEVPAVLAERPADLQVAGVPRAGVPLTPASMPSVLPGMPCSRVYPRERTAELTREDGGVARLRYEDDRPVVSITDKDGKAVYDGPVHEGREWRVPEGWRPAVGAMLRSLYQAENARQPRVLRPRVVIPPRSGESR